MTKKYKLLKEVKSPTHNIEEGVIDTLRNWKVVFDCSNEQIESNSNWFEEVVEEERSIYFETKEVAKGYSFVIIRKNLTNDGQEDNLWSTSKAESIKRELEARCALTREDVEFLLENSYYLGREETSRRLQAILDATGGE